jgi:hypothetical protein
VRRRHGAGARRGRGGGARARREPFVIPQRPTPSAPGCSGFS